MTLQRHTYYGLIHHGIKTLLIDRVGHFTQREYQEYVENLSIKAVVLQGRGEINFHIVTKGVGDMFLSTVCRCFIQQMPEKDK